MRALEDYLASKNEDQPLVYKLLNLQSSFLLQVTLQVCVMNQEKKQVWSVFLEQKWKKASWNFVEKGWRKSRPRGKKKGRVCVVVGEVMEWKEEMT